MNAALRFYEGITEMTQAAAGTPNESYVSDFVFALKRLASGPRERGAFAHAAHFYIRLKATNLLKPLLENMISDYVGEITKSREDHETLLMYFLRNNMLEDLDSAYQMGALLLKQGLIFPPYRVHGPKMTTLAYAVYLGNVPAFVIMMKHAVARYLSPVQSEVYCEALKAAVETGDVHMIELMYAAGVDVPSQQYLRFKGTYHFTERYTKRAISVFMGTVPRVVVAAQKPEVLKVLVRHGAISLDRNVADLSNEFHATRMALKTKPFEVSEKMQHVVRDLYMGCSPATYTYMPKSLQALIKTVCLVGVRIERESASKLPHLPSEMWQLVLSYIHFSDV